MLLDSPCSSALLAAIEIPDSLTAASDFPFFFLSYFLLSDINQSSTQECGDREVILIVSPFHTNQTNGSIAQLCALKHFFTFNVTTISSNTPMGSLINVDEEGFSRTKVDLNSSMIDLRSFETQVLDSKWANYLQPPVSDPYTISRPSLGGPLILLVATIVDPGSDLGPIFNVTGFLDKHGE